MILAREGSREWLVFPLVLLAAALVAMLLLLQPGTREAHAQTPQKAPETIMRANCASCHGQLGEGGGPSWIDPSQTAMRIAGRSKSSIKKWVREGRIPEMPAFPVQEISDAELEALATYINALPGSYIPEPAAQATVTVTDEDPWYNPMQVSINAGDTVKYINVGKTYHPVTQIEFVATEGAAGTDSGLLGPSGIYYRTFDATGKYTFLCKIHPYMRGEVYVGQSFTPPTYSVNTPAPAPAVPGVGEVWVEAQFQDYPGKAKDGVIQVIDASNWQISHMIPVGNNPHNIWFGKGNGKALVTNWFDNTVTIMNAATKAILGEYIAGASVAHVTSDHAGNNWYVSIEGSHYVQQIRQSNMSLRSVAWVSGYGPHGIWYGGGKLVTSNSMDNTFSIIDAGRMTELATVRAGLYPLGAGANTTGTLGAAGNCLSNNASIIDLVNRVKIRDIPISGCGVQSPFTPDDRYIVVPNSPYTTIIDAAKAADPANYPNPADAIVATIWTGKGAHGAAFGPKQGGGTYAYITHKFENYVSVIDLTTMTKAGDVPLVTTTTGKKAIVGATDTGGNGLAVNPNPAPWQ